MIQPEARALLATVAAALRDIGLLGILVLIIDHLR